MFTLKLINIMVDFGILLHTLYIWNEPCSCLLACATLEQSLQTWEYGKAIF